MLSNENWIVCIKVKLKASDSAVLSLPTKVLHSNYSMLFCDSLTMKEITVVWKEAKRGREKCKNRKWNKWSVNYHSSFLHLPYSVEHARMRLRIALALLLFSSCLCNCEGSQPSGPHITASLNSWIWRFFFCLWMRCLPPQFDRSLHVMLPFNSNLARG